MVRTTTLALDATTLSLGGLLAGVVLGGCIYAADVPSDGIAAALDTVPEIRAAVSRDEGEPSAGRDRTDQAASASVARTNGKWALRGDGSTRTPFHWAWVPAAAAPVEPVE